MIMTTNMANAINRACEDSLKDKGNAYVNRLNREMEDGARGPKAIAHSYISGLADANDIKMDNYIRRQLHSAIDDIYERFGVPRD